MCYLAVRWVEGKIESNVGMRQAEYGPPPAGARPMAETLTDTIIFDCRCVLTLPAGVSHPGAFH